MWFKFRKRIKLFSGCTINLSKSGISTTVGMKGLSVNLGKRGAYLNTGIPGTGIYDRKKIGKIDTKNNSSRYYSQEQNETERVPIDKKRSPYFTLIGKFCCKNVTIGRHEILKIYKLSILELNDVISDLEYENVIVIECNNLPQNEIEVYKAKITIHEFEKYYCRENGESEKNSAIIHEVLEKMTSETDEDYKGEDLLTDDELFVTIGRICCIDKFSNLFLINNRVDAPFNRIAQILIELIDEEVIRVNPHLVYNTKGEAVFSITPLMSEQEFLDEWVEEDDEPPVLEYDLNNDQDIILIEKYEDDPNYDRKKYCGEDERDLLFDNVGELICEDENAPYDDFLSIAKGDENRLRHIMLQLEEAGVVKIEEKENGKQEILSLMTKEEFVKQFHNRDNIIYLKDKKCSKKKEEENQIRKEKALIEKNNKICAEYKFPDVDLISKSENKYNDSNDECNKLVERMQKILDAYKVKAKVIDCKISPRYICFFVKVEPGTKINNITSLQNEIIMNIEVPHKGIEFSEVIPGKAAMGIYITREEIETLPLWKMLNDQEYFSSKSKLIFPL